MEISDSLCLFDETDSLLCMPVPMMKQTRTPDCSGLISSPVLSLVCYPIVSTCFVLVLDESGNLYPVVSEYHCKVLCFMSINHALMHACVHAYVFFTHALSIVKFMITVTTQ